MNVIETYTQQVLDAGRDLIDDYHQRYDTFEEFYDDYMNDDALTGNASGRCYDFDADLARNIIWEDDFINYVKDLGCEVGDIINKGEESVDVWARFMALDWWCYTDLAVYFNELKNKEE